MPIAVGKKMPNPKIQAFINGKWEKMNAHDLLGGKKTAVFAIPGAYTPVCTAFHVPGFVEHKKALAAKGIDQIVAISVNDTFVYEAWAKTLNLGNEIILLADGSCTLTAQLDMELDLIDLDMGVRSKRYNMIVDDNVITYLSLEEDNGKCDLSSAENLLRALS